MNQPLTQSEFAVRNLALLFFCATAILLSAFSGAAQTTAFVQQAKLQASDGAAQDSHGFSVAISGDTAIVGAGRNSGGAGLQNRGSAYVYVRNSSGAWTQQQKLAPSDGASNDQFGYSVAINGNTIAVGRQNTTTGQNRADGRVYIFTRTGTVWTETQTLQSNDIAQGDLFGNSLAFENDTLVVGAVNKNNGNNFFQGAAYVFTRTGGAGAFAQQAKLTSSDGVFADFFGYSVAVSDDSIIVGATSLAGQPNSKGKAYVFTRSGSAWTEQEILQASDGVNGDAFGFAVGISNNTAVVGSRLDDVGAVADQGSVYVFNRTGSAWTQTQQLFGVEATQRNDTFGGSVAIKGDTIAVGAPAHEFIANIANHGAVYVFTRSASGSFTRSQKLVHNDPAPDGLGTSLAFDGNSIISGAPSKNSARGAAYIFASVQTNAQKIFDPNGEGDDYFGASVAASGDTLVVGAQQDDNPPSGGNQGSASVYVRDAAGNWIFQQKLLSVDGIAGDFFGVSAAISGDTIVIGAIFEDSGTTDNQGAAYVFTRTGNVWTQQAKLLASDPNNFADFGKSVAIDGETIVAGSPVATVNGVSNRGAAYVFTRSGTTWTQQAKLTAATGVANDLLGNDVSISGDTIFAGSEAYNTGRGAAYVFNRTGTTWTEGQRLLASDGNLQDFFASSLVVRGDTAMIGAIKAGPLDRGAVYYFTRAGGVWTQQQIIQPTNANISAEFGSSLAFDDTTMAVGAILDYDPLGVPVSGAAYVFRKSGASWTQSKRFIAFDAKQNAELGKSVAVSGTQAIAGAWRDQINGQNNQGSVYIFSAISKNGAADFDGDGKADLSVFRPSNGTWYFSGSTSGFSGIAFGTSGDKIVPADYDGDGKSDVAVYRSGIWYLQRSQTGFTGIAFGASDDIPVPADYDGDGKADIAVYRPSNGVWYRLNSSNNQFFAVQFGAAEDKPTLGDFDGDGKSDVAVYRPSNGTWYRINSSTSQEAAVQFGASEDLVVPADYDGDGKTDVAVFRPSSGIWYLQRSQLGFTGIAFGQSGDKPVPSDYDGDGKSDVAVYRSGIWYLQRSQAGFLGVAFGASDDLPTPNAFVR